jgi:hypothetical protein
MGGLLEPSPLTQQERESNLRPIMLGVALVIAVAGMAAFFLRSTPKTAIAPHPYASKLQLSDLKMSVAENFVGASVTYIDGMVANTGDKTVSHAIVHVSFKNSLGEVAQAEDVPLHVLQTSGPYPDAVDLSMTPLPPGQGKPFRLTFEHITSDWDQAYPDLRVTDVTVQ